MGMLHSILLRLCLLARLGKAILVDDGYYYLQIAGNLARGLGSTFDGLNSTNGYHPLWAFALVPVFWLIPESPERALHIALEIIERPSAIPVGSVIVVFHEETQLRRTGSFLSGVYTRFSA